MDRSEWRNLVKTDDNLWVGGPEYHCEAEEVKACLHQVKANIGKGNQKCLIFFHGGYGFSRSSKDYTEILNRHAVECDATILSVDYRLAEDQKNKVPQAGIFDAYAALRWIIDPENAQICNIDKNHVAIFGEDAGAWIAMGVA